VAGLDNRKVWADAPMRGSVTGKLASPVVGIAADPSTSGYWVVTSSGKAYAFHAGKYAAQKITSKVTAIGTDQLREGYWLVASTGKVYSFHVPSAGSMPNGNGSGTVIGIAADRTTGGYWLATVTGIVAGLSAVWHGDHPGQSSKNPVIGNRQHSLADQARTMPRHRCTARRLGIPLLVTPEQTEGGHDVS
jgi:hypothetical protein